MKKRDIWTLDMFAEMPPAPVTEAGGLSCREEISRAMSHAMRGLNRDTLAADMTKLLGWKTVKASVLNMYAAPSNPAHMPPYDVAIAFDAAMSGSALGDLFARKLGGKLVIGKESLDVELGKLERQQYECAQKIKVLKRAMEDLK